MKYANEFREIPNALIENENLRNAILSLIDRESIPGKATEGSDRLIKFKLILKNLISGKIDLNTTIQQISVQIPRSSSPHNSSNKVFPSGWEERLVRTQFSRFYNQAVLKEILNNGNEKCFISHSSEESAESECSQVLAGKEHFAKPLLEKLLESYSKGNFNKELKIPNHPHCTHVVRPT